nr:hypothetical protein [Tanacetum cinerariifolium]
MRERKNDTWVWGRRVTWNVGGVSGIVPVDAGTLYRAVREMGLFGGNGGYRSDGSDKETKCSTWDAGNWWESNLEGLPKAFHLREFENHLEHNKFYIVDLFWMQRTGES